MTVENSMEIRNEKIENLNLIALRRYACPKVNGEKEWFMKCLECDGIEECSCGRRVRDILEKETKPEKSQTEKFEERIKKTEDFRFEHAMEQPDPAQWLVDKGYYSNTESAKAQIRKWRKRMTCTEASNKARDNRKEKVRQRIRDIFEGKATDEEKVLAVLEGNDPKIRLHSLYGNLHNWAKHYPDLEKKYGFMEPCRFLNRMEDRNRTVKEMLDILRERKAHPEEDEVSVEDFLNEMKVEIPARAAEEKAPASEPVLRAETKGPEKPATDEPALPNRNEPKDTKLTVVPKASWAQAVLQTEFGRKKQELRKRIAYIQGEIARMENEAKTLSEQMDLLDRTAEMFGLRPTVVLNCKV